MSTDTQPPLSPQVVDDPLHPSLSPFLNLPRRFDSFGSILSPSSSLDSSVDDAADYPLREKRSDSTYSELDAGGAGGDGDGEGGEEDGLLSPGSKEGGGDAWHDAPRMRKTGEEMRRKKAVRWGVMGIAALAVGSVGWLGGWETRGGAGTGTGAVGRLNAKTALMSGGECNPYEQYGILQVNTTEPTGNFWQPLGRTDCDPVDFVTLIHRAQTEGTVDPAIEFVRNRTIAIFGDSVDRDHVEHTCYFLGGRLEMIGDTHELSPPYPKGQEIPPEDHRDFFGIGRVWPNYDQSRPFVCHVDSLNFRFLNVFHYGFGGETKWIRDHPHFYPPATVEDRFDQILVPLLRSLALKYPSSSSPSLIGVPDLLSLAPGFWGLLRQTVEDASLAQAEVEAGLATPQEAEARHWAWRVMGKEKTEWNEKRVGEILRHVAKGWRGVKERPTILWRALHFIKHKPDIPYSRLVALDQIGRSVVARLIEEGRAAQAGEGSWRRWVERVKSATGALTVGEEEERERRREASEGGLGERLKVDEWGSLMLGQALYFRDEVHPLPLPGSYLYGNMLLLQLRQKVEAEGDSNR